MKINKKKSIEDKLKEFELKIRKNLELQEKLKTMKANDPEIDKSSSDPSIIPVEKIKMIDKELQEV